MLGVNRSTRIHYQFNQGHNITYNVSILTVPPSLSLVRTVDWIHLNLRSFSILQGFLGGQLTTVW